MESFWNATGKADELGTVMLQLIPGPFAVLIINRIVLTELAVLRETVQDDTFGVIGHADGAANIPDFDMACAIRMDNSAGRE